MVEHRDATVDGEPVALYRLYRLRRRQDKKQDEKQDEPVILRVVDGETETVYRIRRRQPVGVIATHYANMKGVAAVDLEYNGQVLSPHQPADLSEGATLVSRDRASKGVFPDEVLSEILAYAPRGVVAGMTSKAWRRVWLHIGGARLRDRLEGTGLPLDLARVSRVFRDAPAPGLEAILHAMGGLTTSEAPPPDDKNSFDDLVFVLSLVVDGKDQVLRVLNKPSSINYEPNEYYVPDTDYTIHGVLHMTFDLEIPIPTKRLSMPLLSDEDSFKSGKGAAQLFMEDDVVKDDLVMKISAFDRKTNRVARDVYLGAANERRVPLDDGDYWDMRWDELHMRYGWAFESDRTRSYEEKYDVHATLYFDADNVLSPVLEELVDAGDELQFESWLRQWQVPIGTNFTTVELAFENIDDIAHLKSVLTWRRPMY